MKEEPGLPDPEDSIHYRLDAGPPPKPGQIQVTLISVSFSAIQKFFKKLFRR